MTALRQRLPWLLLFALLALTPLAYASPPDPIWISGFYDGADGDDVVQQVTSAEAGPCPSLPVASRPLLPPAGRCWSGESSGTTVASAGPLSIRAPPPSR